MKLTKLQIKTINELIVLIEREQNTPTTVLNMGDFVLDEDGFSLDSPSKSRHICATSCCLLGLHAINSKTRVSSWTDYARIVGIQEPTICHMPKEPFTTLWDFLFSTRHPNDYEGAKQRCLWLLNNQDVSWGGLKQDPDTYEITVFKE